MPETSCQVRVRYAETDAMGVAYYGNYLTWFEVGRTDLLQQLGSSYRENHVATNENGKLCRLPTKLTELFE